MVVQYTMFERKKEYVKWNRHLTLTRIFVLFVASWTVLFRTTLLYEVKLLGKLARQGAATSAGPIVFPCPITQSILSLLCLPSPVNLPKPILGLSNMLNPFPANQLPLIMDYV
jgi:hypothetical protein